MTLSGLRKTDLTSEDYVRSVLAGRLDVISLTLTFYLLIFLVVFSTWAGSGFQAEYDLLQKMSQFALIGFMIHFIVNFAVGKLPSFDFLPFPKKMTRTTIAIIGFGFTAVVIAQFLTIMFVRELPSSNTLPLQTIPDMFIGGAAGIAEEWVFAWGGFTFFLLLTRKRKKSGLFAALMTSATVFAIAHGAVGYAFYLGRAEFLPTIFVSRVVLDSVFYLSGGRLTTCMAVHMMINISRSLVVLPMGVH